MIDNYYNMGEYVARKKYVLTSQNNSETNENRPGGNLESKEVLTILIRSNRRALPGENQVRLELVPLPLAT
jgi:hypothetical protein